MTGVLRDDIGSLLATPEPAELGPGPRTGVRTEADLNAALQALVSGNRLPTARAQLVRALVLLWHDHLEASHVIAQGIENPDGSLVHAIMHRREPDYWNSKYWWRRVGPHPSFAEMARRVAALSLSPMDDALGRIVAHRRWDPFAFVDACEAVAGWSATDPRVRWLRETQRIETEVALAHFLDATGG